MKEVASKTFTAPIVREYSALPTVEPLGTHASTMTLYMNPDDPLHGGIEWDIPTADEFASIGLWFDKLPDGTRTLRDYDGVFSLPGEAVDFLREQGFRVDAEFDPRRP